MSEKRQADEASSGGPDGVAREPDAPAVPVEAVVPPDVPGDVATMIDHARATNEGAAKRRAYVAAAEALRDHIAASGAAPWALRLQLGELWLAASALRETVALVREMRGEAGPRMPDPRLVALERRCARAVLSEARTELGRGAFESAVGIIEAGPDAVVTAFALHPLRVMLADTRERFGDRKAFFLGALASLALSGAIASIYGLAPSICADLDPPLVFAALVPFAMAVVLALAGWLAQRALIGRLVDGLDSLVVASVGPDGAAASPSAPALPAPAAAAGSTAIVVVHGVADQAAGSTAGLLARKLVACGTLAGSAMAETAVVRVDNTFDPGHADEDLRAHLTTVDHEEPASAEVPSIQGLEFAKKPVSIREIVWSDLSRPGRSFVSMVRVGIELLGNLPELGLLELRASLPDQAQWRGIWAPFAFAATVHRHVVPSLFLLAVALVIGLPGLTLALENPRVAVVVASAALSLGPFAVIAAVGRFGDVGPAPNHTWWVPPGVVLACAVLGALGYYVLWPLTPFVLFAALCVPFVAGAAFAMRAHLRRRTVVSGSSIFIVASILLLCGYFTPLRTESRAYELAGVARSLSSGSFEFVAPDRAVVDAEISLLASWLTRVVVRTVEVTYAATSAMFVLGIAGMLWGALAGVLAIRRSKHRAKAWHTLRTAIVTTGAPMLVFLVLALPLLAAIFTVLSAGSLFPDVGLEAPLLSNLDDYMHHVDQGNPVATLLSGLVRAAGTRLYFGVLACGGIVALMLVAIAIRVARSELAPPHELVLRPGDGDDERAVRRRDEDDHASQWLERGTYVVADWATFCTVVAGALVVGGFLLEVGLLWHTATAGVDRATLPALFRGLGWAAEGAHRIATSHLFEHLARASGNLIFASGAILAGSASFLAFPGRLQEVLQPVWPLLDVMLDVEGYLRRPEANRSVRARIVARARAVLVRALSEHDNVVVVSHSQGTLVALDGIRVLGRTVGDGRKTLRLVTMGTPLANLYHRFFPHLFAWLEAVREDPASVGLSSWDNVYGGADYVGRSLIHTELLDRTERGAKRNARPAPAPPASGDGASAAQALPLRAHTGWGKAGTWRAGVREHRLGAFGHIRYWDALTTDGDAVTEVVRQALGGPAVVRSSGGGPPTIADHGAVWTTVIAAGAALMVLGAIVGIDAALEAAPNAADGGLVRDTRPQTSFGEQACHVAMRGGTLALACNALATPYPCEPIVAGRLWHDHLGEVWLCNGPAEEAGSTRYRRLVVVRDGTPEFVYRAQAHERFVSVRLENVTADDGRVELMLSALENGTPPVATWRVLQWRGTGLATLASLTTTEAGCTRSVTGATPFPTDALLVSIHGAGSMRTVRWPLVEEGTRFDDSADVSCPPVEGVPMGADAVVPPAPSVPAPP